MRKITLIILAAVFILPLFNSCSSHSKATSLTTSLEQIDMYISLGDTKEAYSLLKKAEENAYTSFERLGIYKRYVILGDTKKAENVIARAHKQFPDNKEVITVYVDFLLKNNRLNEAVKKSEKLKNTEYASFYSECKLRQINRDKDTDAFKHENMIDVYIDAWKGSKESFWLRNAAVLFMKNGKYKKAAALAPSEIESEKDAVFWQNVLYDSRDYSTSLNYGLAEVRSESVEENLERLCVLADSYYILNDKENAFSAENKIIEIAEKNSILPDDQHEEIAKVYMNNAISCRNTGDSITEFKNLNYLANINPAYVPPLALYALEALEDKKVSVEDKISNSLRQSGLKTLKMEKADSEPKASMEAAYSKIQAALNIKETPELKVLLYSLMNLDNSNEDNKIKSSHVWEFLEANEIKKDLYPDEIVEYVTGALIHENSVDTAEMIFNRHMKALYGQDFDIINCYKTMKKWQVYYGAWFACRNKDHKTAETLYMYLNDRYGDDELVLVNLAVIYAGTFRTERAIEYLSKASSVSRDAFTKSEILYRMARLTYADGDEKNTIRSLQYAIQLYPGNNKARLLLKNVLKSDY